MALHFVLGKELDLVARDGLEQAVFAMGCFWGAERMFWSLPGVVVTAVGYTGGTTPHPRYDQVKTGTTGHVEAVRVVFDPSRISYGALLTAFWENHDPTQGMRQGLDIGSQYRSAIFVCSPSQKVEAEASRAAFQDALSAAGKGTITTEIAPLAEFSYAEEDHQQYLAKNPDGYCGLKGTGVVCAVG